MSLEEVILGHDVCQEHLHELDQLDTMEATILLRL